MNMFFFTLVHGQCQKIYCTFVGLGSRGDTDYVVSYIELKAPLRASRQSLWQYRGAYLDDRSAGSVIGSDALHREWLFNSYHAFTGVVVRLIACGLHCTFVHSFCG